MHTKICIAIHSSMQMKLYRANIIQGIKFMQMAANTHAANIYNIILSVHQYVLIKQSPQCAYCMA